MNHYWSKTYDLLVKSPEIWLLGSKRYKLAGELIWKKIGDNKLDLFKKETFTSKKKNYQILELEPICIMLFGLSLELIAKAGYIKKNKKINKTHNISQIIDEINHKILLTEERELCNRFYKNIVWAGKYPVPLYRKEYDKKHFELKHLSNDDHKLFNKLFIKLNKYILNKLLFL